MGASKFDRLHVVPVLERPTEDAEATSEVVLRDGDDLHAALPSPSPLLGLKPTMRGCLGPKGHAHRDPASVVPAVHGARGPQLLVVSRPVRLLLVPDSRLLTGIQLLLVGRHARLAHPVRTAIKEDKQQPRFTLRLPKALHPNRKPKHFSYVKGDPDSKAAAKAAAVKERGLREELYKRAVATASVMANPAYRRTIKVTKGLYVKSPGVMGIASASDVDRVLEQNVVAHIGSMLVLTVQAKDIAELLEFHASRDVAQGKRTVKGLSKGSIQHIRNAICGMWTWLERECTWGWAARR